MAKGKLSKGQKAIIIIVAIVLVLAIAFIGVYFGVLKGEPMEFKDVDANAGARPDYAATTAMTATLDGDYKTQLAAIKAANGEIVESIDEATLKSIALQLMNVASDAKRNVNNIDDFFMFTYSDGAGSANAGVKGEMCIRGFNITLGNNSYSQSGGPVVDGTPALLSVARSMLNQLSRTCTLDNGANYIQGKSASGTEANNPNPDINYFPFMDCDFSKLTTKKWSTDLWLEKDNILNAPGELTNFALNADALKDGTSITYTATAEGQGFWTVSFKLNCPDLETKPKEYSNYVEYAKAVMGEEAYAKYDAVVTKSRAGVRESAGSSDLEYRRYDVVMEIWDNGYLRTYSSDESWAATLIGIADGYTDSSNTTYYYYDEAEMLEYFAAEERSEDNADLADEDLREANLEWADIETAEEFFEMMTEATYDEATKTWIPKDGSWTGGARVATAADLKK